MSESEIFQCLKGYYDPRAYLCIPQVRNGTGFTRTTRTADAIVVSLWPSRGVYAAGFEFKDSRADFLKELKEPAKANEIGKFCTSWSIVASTPDIIKDKDDIPPTWGLYSCHPDAKTLKQIRKPTPYEPEAPSWIFVASVLKSASEIVTDEKEVESRISKAVAKSMDGQYQREQSAVARAREQEQKKYDELQDIVNRFQAASGLSIDSWRWDGGRSGKIGEAVRFVLSGAFDGARAEIERSKNMLSKIISAYTKVEEYLCRSDISLKHLSRYQEYERYTSTAALSEGTHLPSADHGQFGLFGDRELD